MQERTKVLCFIWILILGVKTQNSTEKKRENVYQGVEELDESVQELWKTITIVFVFLLVVVPLIAFGLSFARDQDIKRQLQEANELHEWQQQELNEVVEQLVYQTRYELNTEEQTLVEGEPLGNGHFGRVYRGTLNGIPVAIKLAFNPVDPMDRQILFKELKILSNVPQHLNIITLIGAVTRDCATGEATSMVIELCDTDLYTHLEQNHGDTTVNELIKITEANYATRQIYRAELNPPTIVDPLRFCTSHMLCISYQIALGMEALSRFLCCHRDLRAVNILIKFSRRGLQIAKIADFGLARGCRRGYYLGRMEFHTPGVWASVEVRTVPRRYTQASDVWAFGVVLHEVFGFTKLPSEPRNKLIPQLLPFCHDEIKQLMMDCWKFIPEQRPSFETCSRTLRRHLKTANPQMLKDFETMLFHEWPTEIEKNQTN